MNSTELQIGSTDEEGLVTASKLVFANATLSERFRDAQTSQDRLFPDLDLEDEEYLKKYYLSCI